MKETRSSRSFWSIRCWRSAHGPGLMLIDDDAKGTRLVMFTRTVFVNEIKRMVPSETGEIRAWSWAKAVLVTALSARYLT